MAALPLLELRCFGPPTARVDGRDPPPELLWRKHLALLIYLALSPNRVRTRDHLRGLLWPEKDESYARRSLNEAVRRLRRCLGADRLRSHGDSLEINDERLTVDALQAGAGHASPAGDFLEGFNVDGCHAFEEWASNERERVRFQVLAGMLEAGEEQLDATHFSEAIETGRRALAVHPLSEPAASLVIRALALGGDSAGALAVFHEFAIRLRDGIGEKPGRDLVALVDRIRRGWRPTPGPDKGDEPPLIGHPELYRQVFEAATEGITQGARTVLVTGAPGIGRTRLLAECAARLALGGAVVATARPLASDTDVRWSALRLLLRSGLAQAPGLVGASPDSLAVLAALAPDLGITATPIEPRDTGEVAAALQEVVSAVSQEQPLGLVIDDAHYADGATLSALLGAFERLKRERVVLVLSVPERLDHPSPELLHLRQEIGRRLPGVAVRLKPLAPADITTLVERLAPWCTDPGQREALGTRITHESGGNPFFAVTLLRGIERANTLRDDLCTWPPPEHSTRRVTLPDRIDSAITARVVELDERARNVLAVATIGGVAFDLDLISALTELPLPAVEDALGAAERRHLVIFEGGRYAFSAAVIGEVLRREGLTRGMRQSLRRRAVDALGSRTDLESRVLRAELLARVEPGPAAFEEALRLAREALGARAARAASRAIVAAEEALGKEATTEQKKRMEEVRRLSS